MTLPSACCRMPSGFDHHAHVQRHHHALHPHARPWPGPPPLPPWWRCRRWNKCRTPSRRRVRWARAPAFQPNCLAAVSSTRRMRASRQVVQPELQRVHSRFRRQHVHVRFAREGVAVDRRRAPRRPRRTGACPEGSRPAIRPPTPCACAECRRTDRASRSPAPITCAVPQHDLAVRHSRADLHHRRRPEPVEEEFLRAAVHHLHRFARDLRQPRRFHRLLRFRFAAEPAAHVAGDDPHVRRRQSQRRRHRVLHPERRLRAGPHRHLAVHRTAPSPSASRWARAPRNC